MSTMVPLSVIPAPLSVIPAKAGIQFESPKKNVGTACYLGNSNWIPACAGMTTAGAQGVIS